MFFLVVLFCGIFGLMEDSHAEELYIAQNVSGSDTGADCVNAHSVSWLNTSGNWGSGTNKISAGDTAHLCGTFSSPITIQGSGTSESPITIFFETGAKMSKNHWYQSGSNGDAAIYGSNKSYITIDGGTNGLIEATDNGTARTFQYDIAGVFFNNGSNVTVKNLAVYPLYERVEGTDANNICIGIGFDGISTNLTLQDNILKDASNGMYIGYRAGSSGAEISGNVCDDCGHSCVTVGSQNTNETMSDVQIHDNTFHKSRKWSGAPEIHTNLIHAWAVHEGSRLEGLEIYSNNFSGMCGTNSTALVFLEGYIYSPEIYNNVLVKEVDPDGACGNGLMNLKGSNYAVVANNTFIGLDGGLSLQVGGWGGGMDIGHIIKNNLIYNTSFVVEPYDYDAVAQCDYNVYYGDGVFSYGSWAQYDFAGWKAATASHGYNFDAHSTVSQPTLDANYASTATDVVAKDHGVSLSSYFTADNLGVPRPQGSAWDIGAYEYVSGESDMTAPGAPSGLMVD